YEGPFTPPELGRWSIEYPAYNGGSDWGSVAVDPRRGVIIANYNDMSNYNMLVTRKDADAMGLFPAGDPRAAVRRARGESARARRCGERRKRGCADGNALRHPRQRRMGDAYWHALHAAPLWWHSRDRSRDRQNAVGSPVRFGSAERSVRPAELHSARDRYPE